MDRDEDNMDDKRSARRVRTKAFPVRLTGECQSIYGYARDISSTGMQVRTFTLCQSFPKEVGEKVSLRLNIPEQEIELDCKARVVWSCTPENTPGTVDLQGVRFEDLDEAVKKQIDKLAR